MADLVAAVVGDDAQREPRRRRWRRNVAVGLVVIVGLFASATTWLFLRPPPDDVRPVDAVVFFAGGRGERLALAERLMAAGIADHLVVPNGLRPGWRAGNRVCGEPQPYTAFCPLTDPDTTRGEARVIAELAAEHGWDEIVFVTSTYHVRRARLALDRCFDGTVSAVAAPAKLPVASLGARVAHELVGWTHALVSTGDAD